MQTNNTFQEKKLQNIGAQPSRKLHNSQNNQANELSPTVMYFFFKFIRHSKKNARTTYVLDLHINIIYSR